MLANRLSTFALTVTAAALVVVILALARDVAGGPLDPPGPTTSTQANVEPRSPISQPDSAAGFPIVISQPGSYYLTGNITGVAGKHGIEIATGNVSLDLNGFRLGGVAGQIGIYVSGGASSNVTIRNGIIESWGKGVEATIVAGGRYTDLQILNNGDGLYASSFSYISRVAARGNTTNGIRLAAGTSGGMIVDSQVVGSFFPLVLSGDNIVIRRTTIGTGSQGVNHSGTGLWFDQSHLHDLNFGYVLDGSTAVVTRNSLLQNAGFAGNGVNNHIGSNAGLAPGVVTSTDAWSNVRY